MESPAGEVRSGGQGRAMRQGRRSGVEIDRRGLVRSVVVSAGALAGAALLAACGANGSAAGNPPASAGVAPTTVSATPPSPKTVPAATVAPTATAAPVPTAMPAPTDTPPPASAGATTAVPTLAGCPAGMDCDAALGVALTPPAGWQRAPSGHYPPGQLVFWQTPAPGQGDAEERLLIAPWGTTTETDEAKAATQGMDRLLQGAHMANATRVPVSYGGAPGVLVRGLPGGPAPVTAIVLAHAGAVYKILAPGDALAADQRQALASLRFMARVGPFPDANPPAPFALPKEAVPVAQQALLWDAVARVTAVTISPLLQPTAPPPGMETIRVLGAAPGSFSVEYRGPGKRLRLSVGKLNPPLPSGRSAPILVRGQRVSLALHDPAAPEVPDWLTWREPGRWQPYGNATVEPAVEYFLMAQGLAPDEVQWVADTLAPPAS